MVTVSQTQGAYGNTPDDLKLQEYIRLSKKTNLTGPEQVRLNKLKEELTKKGILDINGDLSTKHEIKYPSDTDITLFPVNKERNLMFDQMKEATSNIFGSSKTEGVGNNQPLNISTSEESARNNVYSLANKAKNSQEYKDYQKFSTALEDYYTSHEEEIDAKKQPYFSKFNTLFNKNQIMRSTYENSEAYQAAIRAYEDFVQNFDGEIELDLGTEQYYNKPLK